jgi:hypothetical protein
MKKVLMLLALISSFTLFAQDCNIETGECGGDIDNATPTEELVKTTCDVSDPDCPMPEEVIVESLGEKINTWGCFSFNRRSGKFGVGTSPNRARAALLALQYCRRLSGHFGVYCTRPQCHNYSY